MTDLLAHVNESIRSRKLLSHGQSVLVAVSGGLDSMVLLHLLNALARKNGWQLSVAHFNHQLRGRNSDGDERFVRKTAAALGLKYFWGLGAVKAIAKARGESIEMTARTLRHDFLASIAKQQKCRTLALAHHADDQVELFFLRLFRGAGGAGLAGMKWRNSSPADVSLQLIRPLLDLTKAELENYARAAKIRFRVDASNASVDILRNRIRHKLLPLLCREFQPALDKTILRVMEIAGAEAGVVTKAAQTWLKRKRRSFSVQPAGLQRRILQLQLQQHGIAVDFDLVESLRTTADKPLMIGPETIVTRDAAGCVTARKVSPAAFSERERTANLKGRAGEVSFDKVRISWRIARQRSAHLPLSASGREVFDADRVGPQVVLRHWRPGDRYQPIGMMKPVKLQDWFVNRKIPQARRHQLIVAASGAGEIFWVEGSRISERFKLTRGTRRRLIWCWRRA